MGHSSIPKVWTGTPHPVPMGGCSCPPFGCTGTPRHWGCNIYTPIVGCPLTSFGCTWTPQCWGIISHPMGVMSHPNGGVFFIHLWVTVHTYTLGCAIWTTLVGVRLHPLGLQWRRIMKKLKTKNGDAQKKRSGREVRGVSPEAGRESMVVKEVGLEAGVKERERDRASSHRS